MHKQEGGTGKKKDKKDRPSFHTLHLHLEHVPSMVQHGHKNKKAPCLVGWTFTPMGPGETTRHSNIHVICPVHFKVVEQKILEIIIIKVSQNRQMTVAGIVQSTQCCLFAFHFIKVGSISKALF